MTPSLKRHRGSGDHELSVGQAVNGANTGLIALQRMAQNPGEVSRMLRDKLDSSYELALRVLLDNGIITTEQANMCSNVMMDKSIAYRALKETLRMTSVMEKQQERQASGGAADIDWSPMVAEGAGAGAGAGVGAGASAAVATAVAATAVAASPLVDLSVEDGCADMETTEG
jgi:hypothetical protein